MKRILFVLLLLMVLTAPVAAQEPTAEPTEVPSEIEIVVTPAEETEDPVTPFIVFVVTAATAVFVSWVLGGRKQAEELVETVQDQLNKVAPFLNVKELAEDFARAALNHGGLSTHQEQVDFAVEGICDMLDKAEVIFGLELDFLKAYVRPAVNAAFSRIKQELAELEANLPQEVKDAAKPYLG